jgi:hypothetical protein
MRKKILIAQLLLLGTLFEMCGNGNTQSPGTTGKAQSSDTTFFEGQHTVNVDFMGCDTSFLDTVYFVKSYTDSIVFYAKDVSCDNYNHYFRFKNENYHFKTAIGNKYRVNKQSDISQYKVTFNIDSISKNGKPYYDSLFFSFFLSLDSGKANQFDRFLGHVINK